MGRTGHRRFSWLLSALLCTRLWGAPLANASDASLSEVYQQFEFEAQKNAPEIRSARELLSQRQAQLYTSVARWLPRVSATVSQTRSQDFGILQSGALGSFANLGFSPQEVSLSRWSLNGTLPLYSRSVHLGVRQAVADRALAETQLHLLESDLSWKLRQLFGNWILSEFRLVTLKRSLAVSERNLKEANLRFQQGERTRIDVLKAEANLSTLRSQQLQREQERTTARDTFLQAVSSHGQRTAPATLPPLEEDRFLQLIEAFTHAPRLRADMNPWLQAPLEERLKRLSQTSLSYQSASQQSHSREVQAQSLWQDFFPELALQGQLYKQGTDWSQATSSGNRSYSIGLTLSVPLFSFGTSVSGWFEKQAAQEQARVVQDQTQARLRDELESLRLRVLQAEKAVEAQRVVATQQDEILKLSFKSYQLGRTTMTELLATENERNEARIQLARLFLESDQQARQFAALLGITPSPEVSP